MLIHNFKKVYIYRAESSKKTTARRSFWKSKENIFNEDGGDGGGIWGGGRMQPEV